MKNTVSKILAVVALAIFATSIHAQAEDKSGSWSTEKVKTTGSWSISGNTLTLTNLSTKAAPDLKIILSPHDSSSLKSSNAMSGAVVISPLKSNKGSQTYQIPAGVDLSNFKSIGIHCEQYTKLFGKSAL